MHAWCVRTADLLACAELLLRRALQRVESAQQEPLSGWWAGGRKLQCLGTLEATPVCILCGNQRTFCSVGRSGRESAARGIGRVGLAWVRESWSGVAHAQCVFMFARLFMRLVCALRLQALESVRTRAWVCVSVSESSRACVCMCARGSGLVRVLGGVEDDWQACVLWIQPTQQLPATWTMTLGMA